MTPTVGFPVSLGVTVLLLVCVVITGLGGRVKLHIPLVFATVLALATAIFFAEKLGKLFDLAATGTLWTVHLALAKTATAAYLLPITTGVLTLRDRKHRRLHFWCAMITLALTVATAITGTWMISVAPWKG